MTTLLLTEQLTREDHGPEGTYTLYGSSCSQITEEAEYMKKLPGGSGHEAEPKSSSWSCSPVGRRVMETEEQLLVVSRDNQVLRIKLEATREAGVQALRSASQKLYETYQSWAEGLKKSHEKEKQQLQAYKLQQEEKLQESMGSTSHLSQGLQERSAHIAELEKRVQRMEEEKKSLLEKKMSFEKMLQQMMGRSEDGKRCLDLQRQISTLQQQICHLQLLIQGQHQALRGVIQEAEELKNQLKSHDEKIENLTEKLTMLEAQAEELKNQLKSHDEKIENLTEKLTMLEAQNKELKDQVELWSGQPKPKVSRAVWTDTPGGSGAFGAPSYLMLSRLRKQES
ncbi:PREDICTED: coiled-coil domain-containing protein 68 [Chaetura pelagica]|uniref:coiled-coil domain-containing protein 68 n=1 Tax=Chaetura pelagica TaxID=8897 RepID=UPI000523625D|nr:PREDICTED: coiled-coil domain-containing protein 68 [Chaetura pelagica]